MNGQLNDLVVDLFNEVKTKRDNQSKLYILEQIREIILHRDVSLLNNFLSDIINHFIIDKSILVRKFIIKLISNCLKVNFNVSIKLFITICDYYTVNDSPDTIITLISNEIKSNYINIMMYISLNKDDNLIDLYKLFNSIVNRLIDYISSDRQINTRISCMNLLEIVVLFGLPPPPPTTDPRLARTMRLEANSSLTKNAEDIPLYHSFINRNEIIQSAEELFSKILLWSSKNGPQGFPFSTSMIALLGELIASIGSLRPKKGSESALALVSMIQGKSSMCLQMSNNEREQLIRATNRLLKILKAYSDPDGVASKLQTALTTLQAFKSSDSQSDKKRTAAQMEGQTDTNESEEFIEQEKLEQQAKLAVDELEKQRLNNKQDNKNITEQISTSIGSNILDSSSNLQILETELVSDNSLVFDSYDIKNCVMIKLNDKQAIQPVENVHADMYKELSMFSLERLLDNYNEIINYGDQAIQTHLFLIVRTAILLSSDESSNIKVPVIQSLSYQVKYLNLTESIPTEVILPRSMWLLISFVFSNISKKKSKDNAFNITNKFNILKVLIHTLYSRLADQNNEFYINLCYIITSKLINNSNLTSLLKDFLLELPYIPTVILKFLHVLLFTGTKSDNKIDSKHGDKHIDKHGDKSKGTKQESLNILGQLIHVYCVNPTENNYHIKCLNLLLWASISEDFELRSKVIFLLTRDIFTISEARDAISTFAIQAVIDIIGIDIINKVQSSVKYKEVFHDITNDRKSNGSLSKSTDNHMEVDANEAGNGFHNYLDVNKDQNNESSTIADFTETTPTLSSIYSILKSIEIFDNGKLFEGQFDHKLYNYHSSLTNIGDSEKNNESLDHYIRRRLHLLFQLCLIDSTIILSVIDIFAITNICLEYFNTDIVEENSISEIKVKLQKLLAVITTELSSIVPAIGKQNHNDDIFDLIVKHVEINRYSYYHPIILLIVGYLHNDINIPATNSMIDKVLNFVNRLLVVLKKPVLGNSDVTNSDNNESLDNKQSQFDVESIELSYYLPLLGGFETNKLEEYLPKYIKLYYNNADVLKNVYHRIVLTRPPPMTKTALIIALHRINFEAYDIKQKSYLDSLSVCLNDDVTFTAEPIKEALKILTDDSTLPVALVRTALLASKGHVDVRKYVLNEFIPKLIQRRIWETSLTHWEGVKHCIKNFITTNSININTIESTLRAILSLPGLQLKSILTMIPFMKSLLIKLLKILSNSEKEEIITGKWIGITDHYNYTSDNEKIKIIKELNE